MPPSTSTTVDKAAPVPTPKTQRPIPDRVAGVLGQWWVDDHRQEQPLGEAGVRFSLEKVAQKVAEGRLHPDVRAWATRKLKEAGNPAGAKARGEVLLNAIRAESGWAPDPTAAEFMPGAHLMLSPDGVTPPKFALGDCFPQGTLVVVRDDAMTSGQRLSPIEKLKIGDEIWGLARWSKVEAVVAKGPLPVDRVRIESRLTMGTDMHLTHDHHVYVLDCTVHPMLSGDGEAHVAARGACDCASGLRTEKRVRVVRLEPGMRLSIPATNPVAGSSANDDTVTMARVVDVESDVDVVPCWDIQTDDHRVYLPEHDVTVSQCDDLTIAYLSGYLAAVESVGARAAVVGHSYSADRAIGHVLGAVFDKGRWWYADPSLPDMPFGECKKPTRERVYAVPSGEMFCDAALCLSGSLPRPPPEDTRGVFLSINGLEDSVSTYPKLLGDFCDVDDPSTGANCGPHPSAQVWDARRSCEQRENIASWHRGEEFEAPDGSDWEPRTQEEFSRAYTGPVGAGARSRNQQEIPVDMVITVPDVSTAETLDLNAISVGPRTARCEPGEGPDGQVRPCASMERPAPGSCNRENFYSDGMPSLSLSGFVDDVYDSVMGRRR